MTKLKDSQHSVSSFQLKDPTKPGHRRFIALWLVDPTQPIVSTANIPPQQADWWIQDVANKSPEEREEALRDMPKGVQDLFKSLKLRSDEGQEGDALRYIEIHPNKLSQIQDQLQGHELFMTRQHARKYREELMEERTTHTRDQETRILSYNFCEH